MAIYEILFNVDSIQALQYEIFSYEYELNLYSVYSWQIIILLELSRHPIELSIKLIALSILFYYRLHVPRIKLEISKRNYIYNAIKLWNTCIGKILEPSILSVQPLSVGYQYIISGNTINSDMTIPIGLFKKKLNKLLLEIQKEGSPCEWENFNTMVT